MFVAIDILYEMTPSLNNSPIISLFFILLTFVTAFFVMNRFVGVMIIGVMNIREIMEEYTFWKSYECWAYFVEGREMKEV